MGTTHVLDEAQGRASGGLSGGALGFKVPGAGVGVESHAGDDVAEEDLLDLLLVAGELAELVLDVGEGLCSRRQM